MICKSVIKNMTTLGKFAVMSDNFDVYIIFTEATKAFPIENTATTTTTSTNTSTSTITTTTTTTTITTSCCGYFYHDYDYCILINPLILNIDPFTSIISNIGYNENEEG